MPKKLDDDVQRLHMVIPSSLIEKVDGWRRREDDLPNLSEAIRRLVELGLDADKKARQTR
ncbi:hypothetical protein QWJ07_11305 [Frankia sp. RB7]|nr:hypothetical protein [Frankia sp. RB7]